MNLKIKNLQFQKNLKNSISSHWLISMLAISVEHKKKILSKLKKNNIETRPIFCPMHKLPMYKSKFNFPVAEKIYALGFSVPSYPTLNLSQINNICNIIKSV